MRAVEPRCTVKPPLKLSVQLFKRSRDLAFQGREGLAPSSIVLTTLSGQLYQGEGHPTDALLTILDGIYWWSLRARIVLHNRHPRRRFMTALAYPKTVVRAVKLIQAQLAGQEVKAFPYRRLKAAFERVGLSQPALSRLVKLGMLEEHELPGDVTWYRPTGHEVWQAVARA